MKIFWQLILVLSLLVSVTASQNSTAPFQLTAPNDWKHETIKFPLDFAPEIKYQGFEELRFSPGMFKPDSNTYFTYAFLWYIEGNQKITPEILENNLTLYFKGLCDAVGQGRNLKMDLTKINAKVTLESTDQAKDTRYKNIYHAVINAYDPFNTGAAIKLNASITQLSLASQDKTVLFFCVSPKPFNDKIWQQLSEIRDSLSIK